MRLLVRENQQNNKKIQNFLNITSQRSEKNPNSTMRAISSKESLALKMSSEDDLFTVKSRKSPSFSENIPLKSENERKSLKNIFTNEISNINLPHFPTNTHSNDTDALEKSKSLFSKKAKIFDLLDDAEECTLSDYLEDLKREELIREYRNLFYKAREIKYLLNEFSKTNKELQNKLEKKLIDSNKFCKEIENAESALTKKSKENESFKTQIAEFEIKIEIMIHENNKKEETIRNMDRKIQEFSQEYHILEENIASLKNENNFLMQKMQKAENYSEQLSIKENQIKV